MFYTKYLQHLRFTKILLKAKKIYISIYYFYEKEIKVHRQTLQKFLI